MSVRRDLVRVFATFLVALMLWGSPAEAGNRGVAGRPLHPHAAVVAHPGVVSDVRFLPDNRRVISVSRDGAAKLWDSASGRLLRTYESDRGNVTAVALSNDGTRLATGGHNKVVRVWDVETGDIVAILEPVRFGASGLAFLPEGKLLITSPGDITIWSLDQEKIHSTLQGDFRSHKTAFTPDSRYAACLIRGRQCFISILDITRGEQIGRFETADLGRGIVELAISPKADRVYLWADDGRRAFAWAITPDADRFRALSVPVPPELANARRIVQTPDGKHALLATVGVMLMDTTPGDGKWKRLQSFSAGQLPGGVTENGVGISSDMKSVVVCRGPTDYAAANDVTPSALEFYRLPEEPAASVPAATPPSPEGGSISWDVIPVTVERLDGTTLPLDRVHLKEKLRSNWVAEPVARRAADGLDYFFWKHSVMLMRQPGQLKEVFYDPAADLRDVQFDGMYFWLGSATQGLVVLDKDGKRLATIGVDQGLGRTEAGILLHPVKPGQVLAFGCGANLEFGNASNTIAKSGWCATVDYTPDPADKRSPQVRTLLTENDLPDDWPAAHDATYSRMHPAWLVVQEDTDGAHVWTGMRDLKTPAALRVNLRDRSVQPFPAERKGQPPHVLASLLANEPPTVIGKWMIKVVRMPQMAEIKPGAKLRPLHLMFDTQQMGRGATAVWDGQRVYLAGSRWFDLDLPGGIARPLGDGLEVDGIRATKHISYYHSGVIGIAAVSQLDGNLYRFSTDPARPAAYRPTRLPEQPTPRGDVVIPSGRCWIFARDGKPMVVVQNGIVESEQVLLQRLPQVQRRAELVELSQEVEINLRSAQPLFGFTLTAAQKAKLNAMKFEQWTIDAKLAAEVKRQMLLLSSAENDNARDSAIESLLVVAADYGAKFHAYETRRVDRLRKVLTPEQWSSLDAAIHGFKKDLDEYFPPKP